MMDNITDDGHLGRALEYIANPEKTRGGRYVAGINCPPAGHAAYETFWETKKYFGKDLMPRADGKRNRLAYHYKFSFVPGEVTEPVAWEIIKKVTEKLMGQEYEALCSMHVDKPHLHGHLIFNSVSSVDGRKYHYSNGDWRRQIQPVVNEICEKYGLSTISLEAEPKTENLNHAEWQAKKEKSPNTSDALKLAIDRCIRRSGSYEQFLLAMADAGFDFRDGKYLSVKNPSWGMERARRTNRLGEDYTKERIRERIAQEGGAEMPEVKAKGSVRIRTSRRVSGCRVAHITYLRLHRCHRGGRFRLSGYLRKYSIGYWRIVRLWHRLHSETVLPGAGDHDAVIRDFKKLQNRIRVLGRYQIETDGDLDRVVERLQRQADILKKKKKVAMDYQMSEQLQEVTEHLKKVRGDLYTLRRIKNETMETLTTAKGYRMDADLENREPKRTEVNTNEHKRTETDRNEQKRTKTNEEKKTRGGEDGRR